MGGERGRRLPPPAIGLLSPQDDEHQEQATDVRSQIRFFEQLERLEKQRKDEQEREILLKAAKVRPVEPRGRRSPRASAVRLP